MAQTQVVSAERAVRFDEGRHGRAKIGYVLLATEQTIEEDAMRLKPPGVGVHFTRAPIPDSITVDTLAEQEFGKPVVCSNQAMIWDCLRLAGIDDRIPGYGRLFREF